jgi:disulfide bond formation protein DsbB
MFCCRQPHKPIESMASILILGGAVALAVALVAQYAFHLPPCHFCLLQRYPYGVAIAAGAVSLLLPRGQHAWALVVVIGLLGLAASGALGLYHTGIEQGWIAYSGGCVAQTGGGSVDAIRAQIMGAPRVSCSDAVAQFAGLSMASWNAIYAFALVLLGIGQYRFDRKRHAHRRHA